MDTKTYYLERDDLLEKIEKFVLSQKGRFLSSRLGKEFYSLNSNKFETKESSILVYFSTICHKLLKEGKIKIVKLSNRGDSLRKKYYEVI